MRVLLISGSFPPDPCGVGDYTEKLAAALTLNAEFKVGVLTTDNGSHAEGGGAEILGVAKSWLISELPTILRTVRAWQPDIVHIQYPSQGFRRRFMPNILPYVCSMYGIPVVQTWHEPHRWIKFISFILRALGSKNLIFVRPNYLGLLPNLFQKFIHKSNRVFIQNASALPVSKLNLNEKVSLRHYLLHEQQRLIMFFGFIYPHKGIETIFDIANPATDELIIIGAIPNDTYRNQLIELSQAKGWASHVRFTGFLPTDEVANLLSVADAVILPFAKGGGAWNTSIHGALAQGTLVITTATSAHGDEPEKNLFTAHPTSIHHMRAALDKFSGRRISPTAPEKQWKIIADEHADFYRKCKSTLYGTPV